LEHEIAVNLAQTQGAFLSSIRGVGIVRAAVSMMRTSQIYLPPRLREADCRPEERAGYYLTTWPYLREKWKKYDALGAAFDGEQPLGQWRVIVQELYDIKLKL